LLRPPRRASGHDLARSTLALLDKEATIDLASIDGAGDQLDEGYGVPTEAMFEAVRLMAGTEGLLLDPVYGGKAFAGLLATVRNGNYRSGDAVHFVMTGVCLASLNIGAPSIRAPDGQWAVRLVGDAEETRQAPA
jgi:1-aminocyclopropane-1-carboxylate deaminase/D-cysteine desulfhydrase-like pyridoxal-dependent ACC family enzyme